MPCAKVNPRQARRFAEATGRLAKTDRGDAATRSRFGALLKPECLLLRSETLDRSAKLAVARRALARNCTATTNRAKTFGLDLLKRQAARRFAILTSMPGVGGTTAVAFIADMPKLGRMDAKQAAFLAGLVPVARQSGTWRSKRATRGGHAQLRQAPYMPALVAFRFNPDLEARFTAMTAAGKPAKVAITALTRRLVVLANALLRDDRAWTKAAA